MVGMTRPEKISSFYNRKRKMKFIFWKMKNFLIPILIPARLNFSRRRRSSAVDDPLV